MLLCEVFLTIHPVYVDNIAVLQLSINRLKSFHCYCNNESCPRPVILLTFSLYCSLTVTLTSAVNIDLYFFQD